MNELVQKALERISGKTDAELKQMTMFELLDILLALEAACELANDKQCSGLLEDE